MSFTVRRFKQLGDADFPVFPSYIFRIQTIYVHYQ